MNHYLHFMGGASGVTGSKTILNSSDGQFIVDFGLFQGGSLIREENWKISFPINEIKGIILTHAHIDHSGLIPKLAQDSFNFKGKIFCTAATFDLVSVLLMDSAKIHEEDARFAALKKFSRHEDPKPLYTTQDVEKILKEFVVLPFDEKFQLTPKISVTFSWAGHILGSSSALIEISPTPPEMKECRLFFSGDIGHKRHAMLTGPDKIPACDVMILESTYGNKIHPRVPHLELLKIYINIVMKRNGVLIIPSFSVGRTQDILYCLNELQKNNQIPLAPIYLDSPLSKKANAIFKKHQNSCHVREELKNVKELFPANLIEIESIAESKELNEQSGPLIIVSASGMIDGGRVVHHVKKRITDPKNAILFVGFQPEGTKGKILLDGNKMLRLHKEELNVEASIFKLDGLSAHGDFLDFLQWINESEIKPRLTILNHGEEKSSAFLKEVLKTEKNWSVCVASFNEKFNLDNFFY